MNRTEKTTLKQARNYRSLGATVLHAGTQPLSSGGLFVKSWFTHYSATKFTRTICEILVHPFFRYLTLSIRMLCARCRGVSLALLLRSEGAGVLCRSAGCGREAFSGVLASG